MNAERDLLVTVTDVDPELLATAQSLHAELTADCSAPNRKLLRKLGEALFDLAFPGHDALDNLARRLAAAAQAPGTKPLRIWLYAADPELAMLPWEYLCLTHAAVTRCQLVGGKVTKFEPETQNPTAETFLVLHPCVSIVRTLQPHLRKARLERLGRLRVLIVWADPGRGPDDTDPKRIEGIEREVEAITKALSSLGSALVEWRELKHAHRASFEQTMREWKPHVVHFASHGTIPGGSKDQEDAAEPSLVLELADPTSEQRDEYLTGKDLRQWCVDAGTLLVILNACWGARSAPNFPSIAQVLVADSSGNDAGRPGVPVVVAHQFEIMQTNAVGFPLPFYERLAVADSVEDAVDAFRQHLVLNSQNGHFDPGWGVPVVFLGVQDSQLFLPLKADYSTSRFRPVLEQYANQVERPFLDAKLEAFLEDKASGIFHLIAAPGTGKTAFLARRVEQDPTVVHCFYRATVGVTSPDECLNELYEQLRGRYGFVESQPGNDKASPRERLDQLLRNVSRVCQERSRREVILIDALDEAGQAKTGENAAQMLPKELPPNVYLLVTSRPGRAAEELQLRKKMGQVVEQYTLNQDSPELQKDLALYAASELAGRVTDADAAVIQDISAEMARRVRANFLVLKCFLHRVLRRGAVSLRDLTAETQTLTDSAEEEYDKHFARLNLVLTPQEVESVHKMLGAFAFSRSPVSEGMVCQAFALSVGQWRLGFHQCCQFLEKSDLRQEERGVEIYRLFHQTFQEYLDRKLAIDRALGHQAWAKYCLRWGKLKDYPRYYALRHLPRHLLLASKEE